MTTNITKGSKLILRNLICGRHERGSSLLIGLIFLAILSMLGLMALRVATVEERMSGNMRDRSVAFQAAEAALRDAERDVQCMTFDGAGRATKKLRSIGCISGAVGADATCTDGLCCNPSGLVCIEPAKPVYLNSSLDLSGGTSVEYGTYTQTAAKKPQIVGVSRQPRYFIEPFIWDSKNYYRITARGFGLGATTQVTLQEVYKE